MRWKFPAGAVIDASPAVAHGIVYIGAEVGPVDATLYALRAATGKKVWTFTDCCGFDSSAAVADGVVYVGGEDFSAYALDAATGHQLWTSNLGSGVDISPAVSDGKVFFESADSGALYAFGLPGGLPRAIPALLRAP